MSAETLRRAAALMRERAEAATPGLAEWWVNGDGLKWAETASGSRAFAGHVASWHPAVALAVANWLEAEALAAEEDDSGVHTAALAVARAYLGEFPNPEEKP